MTYTLTVDGETKQFQDQFKFELEIGKYNHFGYRISSLDKNNCTITSDNLVVLFQNTYCDLTFNRDTNEYRLDTAHECRASFNLEDKDGFNDFGYSDINSFRKYSSFTWWKKAIIKELQEWDCNTNEIKWELV